MNSKQEIPKSMRNLGALLALGVVVALVASIGGGLILTLGYSNANVTQPIWQFGQYVMILGLINLGVYSCAFFQMRRLSKAVEDEGAASHRIGSRLSPRA